MAAIETLAAKHHQIEAASDRHPGNHLFRRAAFKQTSNGHIRYCRTDKQLIKSSRTIGSQTTIKMGSAFISIYPRKSSSPRRTR